MLRVIKAAQRLRFTLDEVAGLLTRPGFAAAAAPSPGCTPARGRSWPRWRQSSPTCRSSLRRCAQRSTPAATTWRPAPATRAARSRLPPSPWRPLRSTPADRRTALRRLAKCLAPRIREVRSIGSPPSSADSPLRAAGERTRRSQPSTGSRISLVAGSRRPDGRDTLWRVVDSLRRDGYDCLTCPACPLRRAFRAAAAELAARLAEAYRLIAGLTARVEQLERQAR